MANTNFDISSGNSWSYDLTIEIDSVAATLGTTGDTWALSGAIMAAHYSTDTVSPFTFTTTDASAGQATMSLSPSDTIKLPDADSVYDVEITNNSSGKVIRILEGVITSDPRAQR
tara:strand:- start:393 stop:737 length:345 start_codon:yes stop_codon:yes gene_type:complete